MSITWPTTIRPGRPKPVVVDERTANAMQDVAASPLDPPKGCRKILRESGLFNLIGRPDRRIAAAWEAMALSACMQLMTVVTPDAHLEYRAWIGARAAARLRPDGPDRYELSACAVPALPGWFADLVDLGPRPRLPDPEIPVVTWALAQLLDESPQRRIDGAITLADDLAAAWPDVASALRAGTWRVWTLEWEWPSLDNGAVEYLAATVLDTPAGYLLVRSWDENAPSCHVEPLTSMDAWRTLTAAGPSDKDLLTAAAAVASGLG